VRCGAHPGDLPVQFNPGHGHEDAGQGCDRGDEDAIGVRVLEDGSVAGVPAELDGGLHVQEDPRPPGGVAPPALDCDQDVQHDDREDQRRQPRHAQPAAEGA
jgi:hypothetical protein